MKGRWESNMNVWLTFMYSQKWNCYFQNRIILFCLPVPTLIYLWEIHIFPGSVCLFCCRYRNRSQTHECGNWDWGRAIPRTEYINGIFLAVYIRNLRKPSYFNFRYFLQKGLFSWFLQHRFICRLSDSIVSEDAWIVHCDFDFGSKTLYYLIHSSVNITFTCMPITYIWLLYLCIPTTPTQPCLFQI